MPEDAFDASWQPTPDPKDIIIPGVDPELPITVQTEQIDQLITLKLQNIDKNFARCHQIVTTKILPALKKYSAGTQPTRDAAKFWRGFFEAAAQIRVSVEEDGVSTLGERTPNDGSYADRTPRQSQAYHEDAEGSDLTFRRGAVSSTPQVQKVSGDERSVDTNDSWVARSVESPIVRIDRHLKDLAFDDEQDTQSSMQAAPAAPQRIRKPIPIPLFESEVSESSTRSVSVHQPSSSSSASGILFADLGPSPSASSSGSGSSSSPGRGKARRKSAARDLRQGVLKSNLMNLTRPGERWDGITDIRSATITDSTVSTLPDTMFADPVEKPRVPLQPYSPSRTREALQRTPSKQAAAMFVFNALSKMPSGSDRSVTPADMSIFSSVTPSTSSSGRNYGVASSSSGNGPTPEQKLNPIHGLFGLSPDDLEGAGLIPKQNKPQATDTLDTRPVGTSRQVEKSPMRWEDVSLALNVQDETIRGDDSYDQSHLTDSSFDDESRYEGGYQSRWAEQEREDGYSSDSRGLETEETVFGARQAAPPQARVSDRVSNMFALPDVSATYHGGRLEDAGVGGESPTPWTRAGAGAGRAR